MTIDCKHPFIHAGAGRTDRLLKALMPSNVALDNREMADLMVFAARFGKVIKYWDSDNAPDGDWSCFWESDYLFFLATVAAANTEGSKKQFKNYELAFLNEHEKPSDINPTVDKRSAALFGLVETTRALAIDVATWGQRADGFPDLQKDITAIVRNTLRQPLRDLIAYAKELSDKPNCAVDYAAFISTQNRHPFATEWNITQYEFDQNINFIDPRADYLATWQDLKRIFKRVGSAHERIRKQAEKYLKTTQNDPNQRQHSPHIALFMSFLHLFKHLQDQLNALPEKHLDYYYNDILHLQNRGEIPDHAHLVFQLALNVYQQTLPVGTLFRAGKAPDGKDMFYSLERPLTLNQAQVVEVKTLLVQDTKKGGLWENTVLDTDKTNTIPDKMKEVLPFRPLGNAKTDKRVEVGFAISSAVLSKSKSKRTLTFDFFSSKQKLAESTLKLLNDNLKVEISSKETWAVKHDPTRYFDIKTEGVTKISDGTFVLRTRISDKLTNALLNKVMGKPITGKSEIQPDGEGLYFISKLLATDIISFQLSGYERLFLIFDDGKLRELTAAEKADLFQKMGTAIESVAAISGFTQPFNIIDFPKSEPVFAAPNTFKKNKSLYNLTEPTLKFSLTDSSNAYSEVYDLLSNTTLDKVNATVTVAELTDFDLYEGSFTRPLGHTQNVDLTSALRAGGLIVRCDEAFKMGLNQLTINLDFKENFTKGEKTVDKINAIGDTKNFAWVKSAKLFINQAAIADGTIKPEQKEIIDGGKTISITFDYKFKATDKDGYVVIELKKNEVYTSLVQGLTIDPPTFADFNIGYTINKDLDETEFFHLSSHGGHAVVNPKDSAFFPPFPNPEPVFSEVGAPKSAENDGDTEGSLGFMAQGSASLGTAEKTALFRGNLFIGVKEPPTLGIVSLLFQVADGTEIDLDSFPPDIDWSYLSENDWKRFPSANIVFDSTKADETSKRSLVQSGVIEFQMPADAKKENTLLNSAYYWLRASATETATPISTTVGALPSLLGIYAQAGSVRLLNSPMDARHFAQALPPTTINQLKFRQAAVKQIEQPYAGFGGRAAEQGAAYHLRISERLRHKKRAITAWDYEHLVLEQFPEIRFVKCINHSLPKTNLVNGEKVVTLDTRKTGAVGIVVMPLKTTNPLRPQVNRSTLENIQSYLKKYSNGFTSGDDLLKVIPPQYQAVVVSLRVKFHAGDTEKLVHNLDNDIARFIAPWAFDGKTEPTFGETLHKTALLSQIEALGYVDYIEDFYITDTLIGTNIDILEELDAKKKAKPRVVVVKNKLKTFIAPKDARTLLTSHQLDGQTPFEINHSIRPL